MSVKAKLEEFQDKDWIPTTAKIIEWVDVSMPGVQQVEETAVFKTSMLKHAVMAAIVEAKENQLGLEAIKSSSNSRAIVATDDLKKGDLCIAPFTTKINVSLQKKSKKGADQPYTKSELMLGVADIDGQAHLVSLGAMSTSTPDDKSKGCFAPFWNFAIDHEHKNCNCELSVLIKPNTKVQADGSIKIPMIKNMKVIKPGAKLVVYVPKPETDGSEAKKKARK